MQEKAAIYARLPDELYQWLRLEAFERKTSQNSIVVRALTELRAAKDGPAVAAVVALNRLGWDAGLIAGALASTGAIDIGEELDTEWVLATLMRHAIPPGPVSDDDGRTSLTGPGIAPDIS